MRKIKCLALNWYRTTMTDIQLDRQMMNIDVALGPLLVDEEKLL